MSGRCVYTSLPAHHLEPEELLQMFSVREKHTIWCFVLKAHSVLSATSYLVWQVVTFLREKRKKKTDKYNFNQNVFTSSQHGRSLVKVKLSLALGRVACILWTLHMFGPGVGGSFRPCCSAGMRVAERNIALRSGSSLIALRKLFTTNYYCALLVLAAVVQRSCGQYCLE
jgi:hypothetical protein